NENLLELTPNLLWKNFRDITLIPHPSKHEEKLTKFLLEFGKQHADQSFMDQAGNVVWKKKATAGMENRKGIVLQAHCDMVPQADSGKQHDFLTDPIVTIIKDGFVMADGTTLGGDDGMGVAAIMAIFEDDTLQHGPIEGLITIDEETGLTGAVNLPNNILDGSILLNLDSEEHGIFYIGCAGGVNVNISKKLEPYALTSSSFSYYRLEAKGFLGGHSGCDIHKNRPNPTKLLFRLINSIRGQYEMHLGDMAGGNMHNAIPREAFVEVAVLKGFEKDFLASVEDFQQTVKSEYGLSDPEGRIEVALCDVFPLYSVQSLRDVNYIVNTLLSGVFAMSADMPGLVETSNNLSVLKIEDHVMKIQCLLRSSVQSQSDYLKQIISTQMDMVSADVEFEGEYPGWKPNPNSQILEVAKRVYKEDFGQEPLVTAIHAGLECGMIIDKYPGMDAISLGPNMYGVHTPTEKVEIESCVQFMQLLKDIIINAPEK
ncbi:MAG: aminoacyl-histidine dipeptidase, partial [Bacteroidales bacterium]|nr:aminoacyl-histidine dipeptidase [Bacteroidales bacterium]